MHEVSKMLKVRSTRFACIVKLKTSSGNLEEAGQSQAFIDFFKADRRLELTYS